MLIITSNDNLYCVVYKRKDRKLWKYLIKNASQFKQIYETEKSIMFKWNEYEVYARKFDELTSVHTKYECILSSFDTKMSKKMYNSLVYSNEKLV